jgi:hypothetical protein
VTGYAEVDIDSKSALTIVLHPTGREVERSELKRAFCSSLNES